jgi:hypothetical protein
MIFFRTLSRTTIAMVGDAVAEILVITILCLLPLIGVAYGSYLHQIPNTLHPTDWQSFGDFLARNGERGQLAFYAISNWATIAWLCGKEYPKLFPWRVAFIALSILGFYYCGLLIDPGLVADRARSSVFASSAIVYVASLICYFLIVLYSKIPPLSAEDTNIAEAESLRQKLLNRRGRNGT